MEMFCAQIWRKNNNFHLLLERNLNDSIFQMLRDESSLLHPKIGDVFLLVFGATCQQGSSGNILTIKQIEYINNKQIYEYTIFIKVTPRSATARLIMIITSAILMFLYTSYSANIVALLQSPSTKIKTLKDLYESRLEIGVDDTVFNRYYFAVRFINIHFKLIREKKNLFYISACRGADPEKNLLK